MKIFLVLFFSSSVLLFSQQGWITRAPLPIMLTETFAVALNGKIYVIGGIEPNEISSAKVHVFDPVQNSWSLASPLPQPRHHIAVAVSGGKIYVIGGYAGSPFIAVNDVYEYNSQNNMWVTKASLPRNIGASCAVEFQGKIYVIGGAGDNLMPSYNYNYVYNPVQNNWDSAAPMPTARDHHTVVVLDSLIYSIGGRNFSLNIGRYNVVEAYSPVSNKWYSKPSMNIGRGGFCAEIMNGIIYVFGGEWGAGSQSGVVPEVEMYDPLTGVWDTVTIMPTARHGHGCASAGDTIYTIGGGVIPGFSYTNYNEGFIPSKVIGIIKTSEIANSFVLYQNYPNPFNPVTHFKFKISEPGFVSFRIFDINGKELVLLVNEYLLASSYKTEWDASAYSSGIYFYELRAGDYKSVMKMVLLK